MIIIRMGTNAFLPKEAECVAIPDNTDPPTVNRESKSSGKSCGYCIAE